MKSNPDQANEYEQINISECQWKEVLINNFINNIFNKNTKNQCLNLN